MPLYLVPFIVQGDFEGEDYNLGKPAEQPDAPELEWRGMQARECPSTWRNWVCTRPVGHAGDHVGGTSGRKHIARWWPFNPYRDLEIGPDDET